jgi:hypothetical protein
MARESKTAQTGHKLRGQQDHNHKEHILDGEKNLQMEAVLLTYKYFQSAP